MNKEQLNYLCQTYGDSTLSNNEKWKSIMYFSTPTSLTPMFSVQDYLKKNQIRYVENCGGEPGFFIIDYQSFECGIFNTDDGLLITFIPLSKIAGVTVTPKITYKKREEQDEEPEVPDVISDALRSNDDDTIEYIITMDGGADEKDSYEIVYNGLGANVVDDNT